MNWIANAFTRISMHFLFIDLFIYLFIYLFYYFFIDLFIHWSTHLHKYIFFIITNTPSFFHFTYRRPRCQIQPSQNQRISQFCTRRKIVRKTCSSFCSIYLVWNSSFLVFEVFGNLNTKYCIKICSFTMLIEFY